METSAIRDTVWKNIECNFSGELYRAIRDTVWKDIECNFSGELYCNIYSQSLMCSPCCPLLTLVMFLMDNL